ncbi:hypothetical protein OG689_44565 [Kitasatospora sp. NBC_00240]|uniref:helix-turn-helix transcriptional regulator n=1 Tax=Kitasatospora sp. NBC_00240 TaxID=2903567 RepID=UPI00225769C5|nr:hypothetical protein [Kitasatospora sp. NBC_00240]MCX5216213.1 hypothetical protein [Kitasatospora sp. NBC_00240]
MIPAGSTTEQTTYDLMAERYGVHRTTAFQWGQEPDFPPLLHRAGKLEIFDADAVDQWLRQRYPGTWAKGQRGKNPLGLPPGGDRDLLPLRRIGELEGKALGREATPIGTLRTYISKGTLPQPDRKPADGQKPDVTEPMWFRSTAYAYLNRPRRTRRTRSETAPAQEAQRPPAPKDLLNDLDLPAGEDTDLLTLEEIREIDSAVRGRPAPKASTLKVYMADGRMAKPDRLPGDGKQPAVEEPSWFRSTAYTFVRRPRTGRPRS